MRTASIIYRGIFYYSIIRFVWDVDYYPGPNKKSKEKIQRWDSWIWIKNVCHHQTSREHQMPVVIKAKIFFHNVTNDFILIQRFILTRSLQFYTCTIIDWLIITENAPDWELTGWHFGTPIFPPHVRVIPNWCMCTVNVSRLKKKNNC